MDTILSQGIKQKFSLNPLTKKYFISMNPPQLQDNRGDADRLRNAVIPLLNNKNLEIPLSLLHTIPNICRAGQWQVTVTAAELNGYSRLISVEPGDSPLNFGIAVDIGTTTVVAYLVDLVTGKTLGTVSSYNSQIKYGETILDRIQFAYSKDNLRELQVTTMENLNSLISDLIWKNNLDREKITACTLSGNTTMIHLVLGLDPSGICQEPYIPVVNSPGYFRAADLELMINGNGIVYCLPSIGSYVGGDVIAGVVVSGMNKEENISMLVDIGTNGEIVLGNSEWLVASAGAAGPALEGGVVKWGMRATTGAISQVKINHVTKQVFYKTIGNTNPSGLCGSGLVDCIAELLLAGIIDRAGKFRDNTNDFIIVPSSETAHGEDIIISQNDIKNLIRTKGAVNASVEVLLESVGCSVEQIKFFYAAGAFGNYIDKESAVTIGLYPDLPRDQIIKIGNSSGEGAKLALLSQEKRQEMEEVAKKITYFEMNANQDFMNKYTAGLFLPHSNLDAYPTIKARLHKNSVK
ncbi:MAG: ASKHA domain-containing protein [Bacillota bacterium]